ncbi:CBS domain-containing protein [Streptomyces sp. NPDC000888]
MEAAHLSRQLAVQRRAHRVAARKEGSTVPYRLAGPEAADLLTVARCLLSGIPGRPGRTPRRPPDRSTVGCARPSRSRGLIPVPLSPLEPIITSLARRTVADAMIVPLVQVADHAGVDTALDVLRACHTDFVLIRNDTGRCAGIVTREQLTTRDAEPWYTDNTRVRDIAHDCGPYAHPGMLAEEAVAAMSERSLTALPVVDDDGYAVGVLIGARLQTGTGGNL